MNLDFDLFIFDLDGTLIDSRLDIANAVNEALAHVGARTWTTDEVMKFIGYGTRPLVQQALAGRDDLFPSAFRAFSEKYGRQLLEHTTLFPGACETLHLLRGKTKAVLSNKRQAFCDPIIDGLEIRPHFALVMGGDVLPEKKPHPAPILHICRALGIEQSRTVMVGDSSIDIDAGRAAGVATVGITGGFSQPGEIEAARPDWIVSTMQSLASLLRKEAGGTET